ncbi:MAG: type II secretion system protein [Phycisphaerales bacterium]
MSRPLAHTRRGFTLIELLVVIAVIALLVGILLPSLSGARNEARTIKCAASMRSVSVAVQIYTTDYKYYPASYLYAASESGYDWRLDEQQGSGALQGYIHWSHFLYENGNVSGEAFQCPSVPKGGAPRTNPGENVDDWEDGQTNDLGGKAGAAAPKDRQVARIAFAGNDAVMPRNKFKPQGGTKRINRFVNPSEIDSTASGAGKTILGTEFFYLSGWRSLQTTDGTSGDSSIKSHRPITPFVSRGAKPSLAIEEPNNGSIPRYFYPDIGRLKRQDEMDPQGGQIDDNKTILNAVGRHHPGASAGYGGSANFVFVDGHVSRMNVAESLTKRLWGDKFFSITGQNNNNRVDPMIVLE